MFTDSLPLPVLDSQAIGAMEGATTPALEPLEPLQERGGKWRYGVFHTPVVCDNGVVGMSWPVRRGAPWFRKLWPMRADNVDS